MADQQQVEILKQGVAVWNQWRRENETTAVDLSRADLKGANLCEANLRQANLIDTIFEESDLSRADLRETVLMRAKFSRACLIKADLSKSDLSFADLTQSDFNAAHLGETNISYANFRGAKLTEARLYQATFRKTVLDNVNLDGAKIESTIFGGIDLSETRGLEKISHGSPSTIGADTLRLSKGKIPEAFLRGCGLPDWEIESAKLHNPSLSNEKIVKIQYRIYDLRATQAIQISPLFISYSHADSAFVDKLEKNLNAKGVRFWRDIHDLTSGKIETQLDRAIRQNPTVLLILSENSLNSDWVQHEVRTARNLEKELGRDALCPIALDDGWKSTRWPQRVMEQIMEYNILDFSKWEDSETFNTKFAKLLSGLDLFYKKPEK